MMAKQTLKVKHNIEVAHRLSLLPGKCQNIHGHSMLACMALTGQVDQNGILLGLDFYTVKVHYREYLDNFYDHRFLLNKDDPIIEAPMTKRFPGIRVVEGDPTTENIARWIGEWAVEQFGSNGLHHVKIELWETAVNSAEWEAEVQAV
jgi:6-pyruvoyltetrahydropterin/6-carboxytetrahydropterin synthase